METTKKSLGVVLIALVWIIIFFNLGDLNEKIKDIGFKERFLVSFVIAIIFALIVLPFLGKEKMSILRNFLRVIIVSFFFVIFLKLRNICEVNESLILSLTVALPPLLFSFIKLKRKKDRGIISE